jgi:hypothetical protein
MTKDRFYFGVVFWRRLDGTERTVSIRGLGTTTRWEKPTFSPAMLVPVHRSAGRANGIQMDPRKWNVTQARPTQWIRVAALATATAA